MLLTPAYNILILMTTLPYIPNLGLECVFLLTLLLKNRRYVGVVCTIYLNTSNMQRMIPKCLHDMKSIVYYIVLCWIGMEVLIITSFLMPSIEAQK